LGPSFDPVAEIMKYCQHVQYLTIGYDGYKAYGYGIGALVKSLRDHPVLESVKLVRIQKDALLLYICLMKKKSVKRIAMVGTQMGEYLASRMLQIFKDSDKCDQLEFLSFFGDFLSFFGHHSSWEQWQEDIDLQLAHVKHTRRSVSDFMNNIKSRETSSNHRNKELQFITNILDANKKDSEYEYEYDQICRPDHLYALIQSKPDYIQRCVDLEREYSVSNKRQKLI
jgi:hypothetical protein